MCRESRQNFFAKRQWLRLKHVCFELQRKVSFLTWVYTVLLTLKINCIQVEFVFCSTCRLRNVAYVCLGWRLPWVVNCCLSNTRFALFQRTSECFLLLWTVKENCCKSQQCGLTLGWKYLPFTHFKRTPVHWPSGSYKPRYSPQQVRLVSAEAERPNHSSRGGGGVASQRGGGPTPRQRRRRRDATRLIRLTVALGLKIILQASRFFVYIFALCLRLLITSLRFWIKEVDNSPGRKRKPQETTAICSLRVQLLWRGGSGKENARTRRFAD